MKLRWDSNHNWERRLSSWREHICHGVCVYSVCVCMYVIERGQDHVCYFKYVLVTVTWSVLANPMIMTATLVSNSHVLNLMKELEQLVGNLPVLWCWSSLLPWCLCVSLHACSSSWAAMADGSLAEWLTTGWGALWWSCQPCCVAFSWQWLSWLSETHQNATSLTSCLNRVLTLHFLDCLGERKRWFAHRSWVYICTHGGVRKWRIFKRQRTHFSLFRGKSRVSWFCVANKAAGDPVEDADLLWEKQEHLFMSSSRTLDATEAFKMLSII